MKARSGPHFHVLIYSDTAILYDYNSWDAEEPIEQFSAVIEGIMASDFEEICDYVTDKLIENEEDGGDEYSLTMETELYSAMLLKCFAVCPVSPNMN